MIGACPAWDIARASSGPGTSASISPSSAWSCVSAATRRRLRPPPRSRRAAARRRAGRRRASSTTALDDRGRERAAPRARLAGARSAASSAAAPEIGRAPVGQIAQRAAATAPATGAAASTVAHEAAAAAAASRLDEPGRAQHCERLAQRHRRDVEPRGELDLGRQPRPGLEDAGADRLAEAAHDLLDRALRARGASATSIASGAGRAEGRA